MLKKMSFVLISILMLTQLLFSIQKLEFSKKRNFYFGNGEYGKLRLEVKNANTYNYQSEIKKPFVLKKNSNGIIELIYDIRLVDDENKEIDQVYKTSFTFVKKNIGKKERIYLSATYKPEIQIVENDTLYSTYTEIELSPDRPSQVVILNSVKRYYSKFNAEYDKSLIGILSDTDLKFSKGMNSIEISLARSENFEKEIFLYRPVGKSKINQLFITVKSSGFEDASVEEDISEEVVDDTTDVSLVEDSYDTDEYAIGEADGLDSEDEESSGGMGFLSMIIIGIMTVVILALVAMLFLGKKGGLYEKYEDFFNDIASIVNVQAKGNNIDKVIEEIMMILLDKFETPYGKEEVEEAPIKKSEPQKIKTLKAKAPVPDKTPEPMDEDLDLDFGNSDEEPKEKTLDKKQILSSGFDFDEINPDEENDTDKKDSE